MAKDEIGGSLLDRKLLEAAAAGMTGQEMADKYPSLTAAQAVLRVKELLESGRSAFDEIENRQITLIGLKRARAEMIERGIDYDDPKAVDSFSKINLAIDRISLNNNKISEEELNKVTEAQARKLLGMIEMAYGRARMYLKSEWGDFINMEAVDEKFHEGLREIARGDA